MIEKAELKVTIPSVVSCFLIFYIISLIVHQVIELPIKHPELFESLGIAQPKVYMHFKASLCTVTMLSGL